MTTTSLSQKENTRPTATHDSDKIPNSASTKNKMVAGKGSGDRALGTPLVQKSLLSFFKTPSSSTKSEPHHRSHASGVSERTPLSSRAAMSETPVPVRPASSAANLSLDDGSKPFMTRIVESEDFLASEAAQVESLTTAMDEDDESILRSSVGASWSNHFTSNIDDSI
jgi:hypothetical protein